MKRLLFITLFVLVGLSVSAQDVIRHTKRVYRPEARADSALLNALDTILMAEYQAREKNHESKNFDLTIWNYYDGNYIEYIDVINKGACYAGHAKYGILMHKGHRFFLVGLTSSKHITLTENKIPVDSIYYTIKPEAQIIDVFCYDPIIWRFRYENGKWIFVSHR